MNLDACLPPELRGSATTITPIAAGLSGAGVYRVDADGRTFVLKVSREGLRASSWRRRLRIQQAAANAGVAPRIVHADEERHAVITELVVDRSFATRYLSPATRDDAIALLGRTIRRVHDLPLPPDADAGDPREFAAAIWSGLESSFVVPAFVGEVVGRVLAEVAPAAERAPVLSHNDVNPTNLVYDGVNLLLLDWETAGRNDPLYDLASAAVFLRMDEQTCRSLLEAYDGAPASALTPRFLYLRRLVAVLAGVVFLRMAGRSGHAGATGQESLDATPSLGAFYQRIGSGSVSIATGEGQWWFGLALVKSVVAP